MRKVKTEIQCDLCKYPAQLLVPAEMEKLGWVKISVDSYHTDRVWTDYDVCPDCVKKIDAARVKVAR